MKKCRQRLYFESSDGTFHFDTLQSKNARNLSKCKNTKLSASPAPTSYQILFTTAVFTILQQKKTWHYDSKSNYYL